MSKRFTTESVASGFTGSERTHPICAVSQGLSSSWPSCRWKPKPKTTRVVNPPASQSRHLGPKVFDQRTLTMERPLEVGSFGLVSAPLAP